MNVQGYRNQLAAEPIYEWVKRNLEGSTRNLIKPLAASEQASVTAVTAVTHTQPHRPAQSRLWAVSVRGMST